MKKAEIVVGGVYSNGKGRIREVIAEGPEYKMYQGIQDDDNVRYKVINDGSKKNLTAGKQYNMTRQSFAQWAKEKVES